MSEYDHISRRPHATGNGPSAAEALKSTDAAAESAPSTADPAAAAAVRKAGLPTAPLGPVSSGSAPSGGSNALPGGGMGSSTGGFPGARTVSGSAPGRR
jgi:hypothetical protein